MKAEQYKDGGCRFWIERTIREERDDGGTVTREAEVVCDREWSFGGPPPKFKGDWYENCKREVIALLVVPEREVAKAETVPV